MTRTAVAGVLIALAALAAGCFGGSTRTKAGGAADNTITLTMQAPDAPDADAEYFIQQVKERTEGRIRIVVGASEYQSRDPDNEARLVSALRSGKEQMAYIPSRAWERASSVASFRALQAPFLVADYPLLRRITTGALGRSMLAGLAPIGLVGLGLVPDELRRPLGRQPLTSARAYRGARIRVVTSPTSALALRALGAVPLTDFTSDEVGAALRDGRLDGVESATRPIEGNHYTRDAPYLPSNLALFAKTQTIAIRRDVFARLAPRDQAALRAAAAATVAHANPAARERAELSRLCDEGLRIVRASPAGLASLRRAADAAYAELERDATTKRLIGAIETVKRQLPATVAPLPRCRNAGNPSGTTSGLFPQGRFMSPLTEQDFERGGATQDEPFPQPFVITIRAGRWRTNEQPAFSGRYIVRGDEVTFVIERPPENEGVRETVAWSYYRGQLSLRIVSVADAGSRVIYTAHPWTRTGDASPTGTTASHTAPFPNGTFQTTITRDDLEGTGFPLTNAHTETLTFRNGTWRDVWFRPRRADQPPAGGHYIVRGDRLTLETAQDVVEWSYYRGQLTFRIVDVADPFARFTYTVHPWRKVR